MWADMYRVTVKCRLNTSPGAQQALRRSHVSGKFKSMTEAEQTIVPLESRITASRPAYESNREKRSYTLRNQ